VFCREQLDAAVDHYEGFLSTYTNPSQSPRSVLGGNARIVTQAWHSSGRRDVATNRPRR